MRGAISDGRPYRVTLLVGSSELIRFVEFSRLWHHVRNMRTNQNMRRFLNDPRTSESSLSPGLLDVLASGFVEENDCVLLASEAHQSVFTPALHQDETGYECFANHLHVEKLGEALEFAQRLNEALREKFTGRFAVIVSYDGREATVRFHRCRANQAWLSENLEDYQKEGIAVLD